MVTAAPVARCVCSSRRSRLALPGVGWLRRCSDCGLVYRSTPAPAEPYGASYFSDAYSDAYFDRSADWRFEARRRADWLLAGADSRRALEAGCAGGFFLAELCGRGIDAQGVEPADVAATYARDQFGLTVTTGPFELADIDGRFDAVCAFHVLEHVNDPERFLARARDLLEPRGRLALEVPNVASAAAREAGAQWEQLQPRYHLWHFMPSTLAAVVSKAGFAVEECDTIFAHHYVRPAQLPRPFALRSLARSIRVSGSLRSVHPALGDNVRLLARRR